MKVEMEPIGYVETKAADVPRHWSLSEVEGWLMIQEKYRQGLNDLRPGQKIVVLFHFHKSPPFRPDLLMQTPPHRDGPLGVFSICSPRRPNPIGLSVVEVMEKKGCRLRVKGIDMIDGTPILDLKPHIADPRECPSFNGERRPAAP
jgi:tRNA-Thr(GGU) m(6)t(6)A37 methyltransferase TsaA